MLAGRLNMTRHQFAVVDVPIPEPGPGQVRIKVAEAAKAVERLKTKKGNPIRLILKP